MKYHLLGILILSAFLCISLILVGHTEHIPGAVIWMIGGYICGVNGRDIVSHKHH